MSKYFPYAPPFIFLLFIGSNLSAQFSQESTYYWDDFEIPASEAEQKELHDAEYHHADVLEDFKSELRIIQRTIRAIETERNANVRELLTPLQMQAINRQRLRDTQERVVKNEPFLRDFAIFSRQISLAKEIVIYEGLPRKKAVETIKLKKESNTIVIDSYDFYAAPLTGRKTTVEKFRELLTNYREFSPTAPGGKFCGGFHPDIALIYQVNEKEYQALICMGCFELRVNGAEKQLRFDFSKPTWYQFLEIIQSIFINHQFEHPLIRK